MRKKSSRHWKFFDSYPPQIVKYWNLMTSSPTKKTSTSFLDGPMAKLPLLLKQPLGLNPFNACNIWLENVMMDNFSWNNCYIASYVTFCSQLGNPEPARKLKNRHFLPLRFFPCICRGIGTFFSAIFSFLCGKKGFFLKWQLKPRKNKLFRNISINNLVSAQKSKCPISARLSSKSSLIISTIQLI